MPHGCAGSADDKNPRADPGRRDRRQADAEARLELETIKGKYAAEYELHGSKLTEGVKEVVWSGGKLADDNYDEFVVSHLSHRRSEAQHHAVFPGGAGMRAGGQPLDRYPAGGQVIRMEQVAGARRQADAEAVRRS